MAAKQLIFSALRGTIKTIENVVETDLAGNKIEKAVVKMVSILEGHPIPDTIAPDELDKLKRLGMVVEKGTPTGTETAIAAAKAGKTPKTAGKSGSGDEVALDLSKLADYADGDLVDLWAKAKPTITAVLEVVGSDAGLAEKALAAEKAATKGDPRKGLVDGLNKVITAGAGSEPDGGGAGTKQ